MALPAAKEGTIPFKIASIDKPCFTYYKIFGKIDDKIPPLVVVHGGPGGGHGAQLPFAHLWLRYKIPVIFYDQIGCGQSTHLPETAGDKSFWTFSLFVAEFYNLLDHFGLQDGPGFYLLGKSFGGMLVTEFAISRPRGLKKLIICSGSASEELSTGSFWEVIDEMPSEHKQAILDAKQTRNVDSEAYKAAFAYLIKTYMCRSDGPLPKEIEDALKNMMDDDTTVMQTLVGLSPFFPDGSFLGWSSVSRLHLINVPTMIQNGEFDTNGRDCAQQPFFERIPRVRWVKIAGAGHSPIMESDERREKVLRAVGEFLTATPSEGHQG
ncbi:hypothetical protein ANO11243_091410 [Dothideomycetidae sp. 11243]|nr:hypothetical protein ANO11243_091410 [fungal sp. No.11243]